MYDSNSFFLKFKSNLLVKRVFFRLNAASTMEIMDLISRVHVVLGQDIFLNFTFYTAFFVPKLEIHFDVKKQVAPETRIQFMQCFVLISCSPKYLVMAIDVHPLFSAPLVCTVGILDLRKVRNSVPGKAHQWKLWRQWNVWKAELIFYMCQTLS